MSSPLRTCVGCREVDEQNQLLRWVVDPQNPSRILPDANRSKSGRGAWLHPRPECVQQAVRKRGFSRAFRSGGITHNEDELLLALQADSLNGNCSTINPN